MTNEGQHHQTRQDPLWRWLHPRAPAPASFSCVGALPESDTQRRVRGSLADAKRELRAKLKGADDGQHVAPSRVIIAEHVRSRIDQWKESGDITVTTHDRYSQLVENQIVPAIGKLLVQRLTPQDIERWHSALRKNGRKDLAGGISARTITAAHRMLGKALNDAVRFDLVARNVTSREGTRAPRVEREEAEIIPKEQINETLTKLKRHAIYDKALIALFTGPRRSEVLALRWGNVDLDGKMIKVREGPAGDKAGREVQGHDQDHRGPARRHAARHRGHRFVRGPPGTARNAGRSRAGETAR